MIRLSKIDDELTVYKGKDIILFGAGYQGRVVKRELESKGFQITGFCDNDKKKWGEIINGTEVISPDRLCEIYNDKMLVQISCIYSSEIEKQLQLLKIDSFISYREYCERMEGIRIYCGLPQSVKQYKTLCTKPSYFELLVRKQCIDYALRVKYYDMDSFHIVCLPPKTGNHTIEASIRECGGEFVAFRHTFNDMFPVWSKLLEGKKIKIITGVREPVAQNISFFFQQNTRFYDIPEYWKDGGDVQFLWDKWISNVLGNDVQLRRKSIEGKENTNFDYMEYIHAIYDNIVTVQYFFERNFEKYNGINVYDYSFDQEQGYSIIREGNIEVFIYQLEKLNAVKDSMGEFLGLKNFELKNENVGAQKWYAPAYRQALEELKLSREYVEYCYGSRLARHFYSNKDIEQFKRRWSKNIDE